MIPTRNRPASLRRTIEAIVRQQRPPDEIVIVDASDEPLGEDVLAVARGRVPIRCLRACPGVCSQRNLGIRSARGSHVWLCDDDIEPPPDCLGRLLDHLDRHPETGAVTGVICEPDDVGRFTQRLSAPSFRYLLFAFVFQLTLWADVEAARGNWLNAVPLAAIKRWYRRRGNTWTLAGWPLVTQVRGQVFHTAFYGLGGALIRRSWLLASPYDERLDTHGIGDNYGVALGFPGERAIAVLVDLPVFHHRVAENRLDPDDTYYRRVLALDYFMRTSPRFSPLNTAFLAWSLVGRALMFWARGHRRMARCTLRALARVVSSTNPLLAGKRA